MAKAVGKTRWKYYTCIAYMGYKKQNLQNLSKMDIS